MGKAGKWIKSFLIGGKKEKITSSNNQVLIEAAPIPKDKKRWSFRRSSATAPKNSSSSNESTPAKITTSSSPPQEDDHKKPVDVIIIATSSPDHSPDIDEVTEKVTSIQEAESNAAIKIQSVFRSYLARKALRALRGLVKIQALVRGHLVRKQATATLICMQALVTAQARARAHRMNNISHDFNFSNSYHGNEMEENIKIVEMDQGESKFNTNNYSNYNNRIDNRFDYINQEYQKISPSPSAITDISPRTCSGHFEDYPFATAQSSPQCYYSAVSRPDPSRIPFAFPRQEYSDSTFSYDYPLYPNYMANTQSSRAKARSQSAPKQRPETFERQLSRRRPSVEGRNIPRAVRMQRCSSHVGSAAQNYQIPWSIKLDKSTISLKDSECGSTCSVLTNANYCRTVISYDPQGNQY